MLPLQIFSPSIILSVKTATRHLTLSSSDRKKVLDKKKKEDRSTLDAVESLFISKRKYVVKLPKPGSAVILLVSGGVDSTVAWAQLLHTYKLEVFPLHVRTGQPRNIHEQSAVLHYARLFHERYPTLARAPLFMSQHTTPPEIRRYYRGNPADWVHPTVLAKAFKKDQEAVILDRSFSFSGYLPYQAIAASQFLALKEAKNIRTVISSTLPSDAEYNAGQTLTSNRSTMLSMCSYTYSYDWQFFSLAYEPLLNLYQQKKDLISWADKHNISLAETYTCFKGTELNCGVCTACQFRRDHFESSGVKDKTMYEIFQPLNFPQRMKRKLKRTIPYLNELSRFKQRSHKMFRGKEVKFRDYY